MSATKRNISNKNNSQRKKKFYMQSNKSFDKCKVSPKMTGLMISCFKHKENSSIKGILTVLNLLLNDKYAKEKEDFDTTRKQAAENKASNQNATLSNDVLPEEKEDNNDNSSEKEKPNLNVTEEDKAADKQSKSHETVEQELSSLNKENQEIFSGIYFKAQKTDLDCIIFVQFMIKNIKPTDVARQLFEFISLNKDRSYFRHFRHIIRVTPVDVSCSILLEEIKETAKLICKQIDEEAEKDKTESKKFAVEFNKRATDKKINRAEIIDAVATQVSKQHKVDLNNPEVVVIVEIFKNICAFSVINYYYKYSKLNLEVFMKKINQEKNNKE